MIENEKLDDFLKQPSFKNWAFNKDPKDYKLWEDWIKNNPSKANLALKAKDILLELDIVGSEWNQELHEETYAKIRQRISGNDNKVKNINVNVHPISWNKIAASVLILIASGFILFFAANTWLNGNEENKQNESEVLALKVRSSPSGQKLKVKLPDGSIAYLNSDSEVKYGQDFGISNREIFLVGEAFFEVKPNKDLPFKVHSNQVITKALGTSFNVNAYWKDQVNVQLATGKVQVYQSSDENNGVMLLPGEEAEVSEENIFNKSSFNLDEGFLWKKGVLDFPKIDFDKVVVTLERWYGVDIDVQNFPQDESLRVSGRFQNKPLFNVLESLSYSMGFEYEIDQKQVTINFNPIK
ncbi:FecR family protein [Echinicola shivajiensis]|uniref:FecR family protein n=1 Tax=Echinicola shivajiensis TaxID=1035916 RepID=UPI001BFC7514|nr:FecR family protein [Echinicola shivajiensis]